MIRLPAILAIATLCISQDATNTGAAWQPWSERLHALSPGDPLAYIEIAEEMVDSAQSAELRNATELRQLARHLFGLAGAIDPETFGRSACFALAAMSDDEQEKARFRMLADWLPGRDVLHSWTAAERDEKQVTPGMALALSEALGFYRQGHGNRALSLLEKHDLEAMLERFGDLLPGGPERFLEDCRHYTGGKKPTIFEGGIARMLILESALLSGTERSWAGEVLLTSARPLVEIDPAQLDEALGVDATKPYFVNGQWERVVAK